MSTQNIRSYIKREFENLKESSNILHSLIEKADYGLAIITSDFNVVDVNSKMLEWFPGVDIESFPLCYQHFHCSSGSVCPGCPAVASIREGKKYTALIESASDNGFAKFRVTCTPLKGPDGGIWGVLEIVEAVTAEATMQKEFTELEAQYIQIIENAGEAIITFNINGEILQINKKAQQLFGYSAEEVRGKTIYFLIPEDNREAQKQALQKIFTEKKNSTLAVEGTSLKKDGTTIQIEMSYSFIKTTQGDTLSAIIRDISERKISENRLKIHTEELKQEVETRTKQLARSEERYRTLVGTANDAIISTDKEGKIIYFNHKAETIYDYSRNEILGKSISEIAPEEIWKAARLEFKKKEGSAHGKLLESWGSKKDRSSFPVEYTISVFEWEGEYNLTLIARDITRRKNLEQELQQHTAKLEEKVKERTYELTASQQTLKARVSELSILKEISEALSSAMDLEAVLNIILVGATSHHGLGFNRAFLFLLSDDGSSLEGKVAIGPSDSNEAQKIWGEILGKNLTLKQILQSYTNKLGKVDTHVNNIIRNIRIPTIDEEDILIQVVKGRKSFNIKDAFNHPMVPRSLITLMNCNAFALIPLIAEDNVLGVLWADNAITKNPIDDHDIERLRAFAINASLAIEKSNLYKNIQEKVIELDKANKELKENRDRLIRSEKLVAVGEMSATVAHGIRNPLVSIGGFARRLLKKEKASSTSKKYLQIIVDEIDRLETILSELLDFVRPRKLNLKLLSLQDLVSSTLQVFYFEFEKRNITVQISFMSDIPPQEIDSDQFKRVLHNLFNNAMDAMPEGGILKIETEVQDSWTIISISDTGIGISDNEVEKIFHPFFTSKETGSGLGLAVCNQIISIHGGHIKLRRQIPQGVVFDIYLPVVKP